MSEGSNVSVVVVSYNTLPQLRRCLGCVEVEHELIVVDNDSRDGSPEMVAAEFPHAKLIRNTRNTGFGAANNQGLEVATRPLVLFLNSDCYAEPGAIAMMAEAMDRGASGVVAAGGHLLNPDGSTQPSTANELSLWAVFCEQTLLEKAFPGTFFDPYWNTDRLLKENGSDAPRTAQAMGACLMIRPLERFDERYFLYCEDTDLCRRLSRHGDIVFVPSARFTHELGASSLKNRWLSVARYNRGKELYFRIHHGVGHMFACWLLNRLGALLRVLLWTGVAMAHFGRDEASKEKMGLFLKVLIAPFRGPDRAP